MTYDNAMGLQQAEDGLGVLAVSGQKARMRLGFSPLTGRVYVGRAKSLGGGVFEMTAAKHDVTDDFHYVAREAGYVASEGLGAHEELIRDMARELRGLNDSGIPTDCMEHERRMRDLGIEVRQ